MENHNNDSEMLITLTADIVAAHVANNAVSVAELPTLISNVFHALSGVGQTASIEDVPLEPAVSVRASIKNDYLVCLEDGKKMKMLKRHLATAYNMTPEQYRLRWNLPADYPMVAPAYAEKRRELAMAIGLGRKSGTKLAARPGAKPAAKRGRKPAATPA